MNEDIIKRWNEVVAPHDFVYILGDFAFAGITKIKAILSRLNGKKILIRGNHDVKLKDHKWLEAGMFDVKLSGEVTIGGRIVKMSHFPYPATFWERVLSALRLRHYDRRWEGARLKNEGLWLLCGHVHHHWKHRGKMINVGWDQWGRPVSPEDLRAIISATEDKG